MEQIQGGDPTGTGMGGESIWGQKFEDEFKPQLSHVGRGNLSMANSGPNTNGSQFFITFRSCKHLDGKHTIFGKLVGGIDILTEMERIEVDNRDRPIEDIIIERAQVFVDPYTEADEQLAKERAEEAEKQAKEVELKTAKPKPPLYKVYREGVGKYLNKEALKAVVSEKKEDATPPLKKKKKDEGAGGFGDFSAW